MKKSLFLVGSLIAVATMFSCAENAIEPKVDAPASPETRVGNSKVVMVYVETNDVNPLNALTYVKCGTDVPFIDILNIFAANINKSGNDPCIHFNQELAPIMENVSDDIAPLQAAGIKVCLTLLPNWQGIGFANLQGDWTNQNSQIRKFAKLVTYVVCHYGFDGINCDDEYAGYTSYVSGSYGNFIKALRAEFNEHCPGKLITVFRWGNYSQINAVSGAGALIDYADHGSFSPASYNTSIGLSGVSASKWMPVAINLGNTYSNYLDTIEENASYVVEDGYAGVMGFNMRSACDVNATPVFNAWAQGLGEGSVCWNGDCYPQRTPFIPGGYTITNADVPSNY